MSIQSLGWAWTTSTVRGVGRSTPSPTEAGIQDRYVGVGPNPLKTSMKLMERRALRQKVAQGLQTDGSLVFHMLQEGTRHLWVVDSSGKLQVNVLQPQRGFLLVPHERKGLFIREGNVIEVRSLDSWEQKSTLRGGGVARDTIQRGLRELEFPTSLENTAAKLLQPCVGLARACDNWLKH